MIDTKLILPTLKQVSVTRKGRHYVTPSGALLPSVTNVLGIIDKPALAWWGASVERDMVVEHAVTAYPLAKSAGDFRTVLGSMLPRQQARFRKSKEATDIGTETHDLIQHHCKDMLGIESVAPRGYSEQAALAFMAWQDWAANVNLVPLMVEQQVCSERIGSAGTFDLYGTQNWPGFDERRHCLYDWKSSKVSKSQPNGIYPESLIQVATYAQMLVELGAPENTMGCIVRLPKSLEDPIFDSDGKVDHVEIMPAMREQLAEGFASIVKTWVLMKETLG